MIRKNLFGADVGVQTGDIEIEVDVGVELDSEICSDMEVKAESKLDINLSNITPTPIMKRIYLKKRGNK